MVKSKDMKQRHHAISKLDAMIADLGYLFVQGRIHPGRVNQVISHATGNARPSVRSSPGSSCDHLSGKHFLLPQLFHCFCIPALPCPIPSGVSDHHENASDEPATERLRTDYNVQQRRYDEDTEFANKIHQLFTTAYPEQDFSSVTINSILDILRRPEVITTVTQYHGQTSQLALEQVLALSVGQVVRRHELLDTGLAEAQTGSRPRSSTVGTQNQGMYYTLYSFVSLQILFSTHYRY